MADVSDSSSSLSFPHCVTLKLNSSNYLLWKIQFETWLNNQMMLGYVTGATPCPSQTITVRSNDTVSEVPNPEFNSWMRNDQKIMGWLFGSLSEDALRSVYGIHTAREVWFYLAKKYNRTSASRKSDLQRKLNSVVKQGKTMAEYLNSVKQICDQLDSIGCPVPENEKIFGVLNGLGQEYESITTMIEGSMDSFPMSFEDVEFKLTNFDDKIQTYEDRSAVSPHSAFTADREYSNRGRGRSNRGRGNFSTRGRGFHQQISNGSSSDSGTRPTCQICNKYGHSAYKCYKRFDHAYQSEDVPNAFAAMRVSDHNSRSGNEWYPDTGATAHITNNTAQLQSAQPYTGDDAVIVGNGDFLPITHIGSAVIPSLQGQMDKTAPHQRKQT